MSAHNIFDHYKEKKIEIIPNAIMSAAIGLCFVRESSTSSK